MIAASRAANPTGGRPKQSTTGRRLNGEAKLRTLIGTAVLAAFSLSGCSTIVEGSSQSIAINTQPPGASCAVTRHGEALGKVDPTPGSILIEKTKYDLTITCDKDGYGQATRIDKSGADAATFGNIVLGGGIGWAIDSATGSDNKYDTPVTLTLTKNGSDGAAASS